MKLDGGQVSDLITFMAVARHRNFRQAAIERGLTKSAVSHAIRRLEERTALRLFNRTTRSVSLTEAGARLLADLIPAIEGVERAVDDLNHFRESAYGSVRVNVAGSFASAVIMPVLPRLLAENTGLELDIVATDRLVDIVDEGFDAGIRLGERISQDMIAAKIGPKLRFAVVASPRYADRYGLPGTPRNLGEHQCIRYRFPSGSMFPWEFERGDDTVVVDVSGPLTLDSQPLMVEAALADLGLAYVWDFQVKEHLADGKLVRCLDDWCPELDDLFIYYPSRKHMSAGLRVLIEALRATR
jgi:DNA-binding transcriptional LysR family regulator